MALTIGNWVLFGFIILAGIVMSIIAFYDDEVKIGIVVILGTIILAGGFLGIENWRHTHTASGIRDYKDFRSEFSNGLEREIIITAEDGREIFHYEGKVDIESNHEDNYIKFEGEDGCRYMIYYGIQDTIKIIEKKR